ncbi:DUF2812 domain-containing protein [Paenibacillus macquariensis]|uniref:DUF2812 domain-containing protein n=1 Tax=Paenibacillus macquariensis TaxID=948756 RepID=A0ABY1K1N1_9BACL|nr:DUF2812 domain-containing protein [Paenibacillus macquariensis]MEC0091711.1 DUF2812 domain-containing protein [Paenibacillus macquariensis]OAB32363.1 hypothetical protein PMSM_17305 [Paenibacillus macquariensis subsp. macquariensis]SIR13528.1 Protein of unknown function [Paenibacillus macquariensis]
MITKVFRPFWSYDVHKTEDWLSSMAEKGYYLVKLNRGTRYFFFIKGDPKTITYRFVYDKIQPDSLPKALLDEGWTKISQSRHWYVIVNEKPLELIKTSPVREGIIKHNRLIMYIFGSISIYLTTMTILFVGIFSLVAFSQDTPSKVIESPYWILTYIYFSAVFTLWVLSIYSVIKINKTNKELIRENIPLHNLHVVDQAEIRRSKSEEKQLKRSGQMVVKRKFGWMYAPDKLEHWLESMEEQGYHLYRMSKEGTTFYFIIGSPRKVSYCADFQNITDESYNNIHRESGWKSVFISNSPLLKWTLWSRRYSEGEERPQIYSEKSHHLKYAKRIALTYSCLFLPSFLIYILNIKINMASTFDNNLDTLQIISMISLTFAVLTFGSILARTWLSYMRLKKRYANHT